jgi:hypothetical protein
MSGEPGLAARTQSVGEFGSGNPWDGAKMPEDFDPDKNEFLSSGAKEEPVDEFERAYNYIDEIIASPLYHEGEGLLQLAMNPDGTCPSEHILSSVNALWGMFIHAAQYDSGSLNTQKLVDRIKGSELALENGMLGCDFKPAFVTDLMSSAGSKDTTIAVINNSLWGLLLNAAGYKEEARNIATRIMGSGLYRKDGLVFNAINGEGLVIGGADDAIAVNSGYNIFLGLLLHAVGYEEFAKNVVESMQNIGLYQADVVGGLKQGILSKGLRYDGKVEESRDRVGESFFGLLAHATGNREIADTIMEQRRNLYTSELEEGSTRALLHRAFGEHEIAEKKLDDVKGSVMHRKYGNLIAIRNRSPIVREESYVVLAYHLCLFGLAQLKDGYKVFTGEK